MTLLLSYTTRRGGSASVQIRSVEDLERRFEKVRGPAVLTLHGEKIGAIESCDYSDDRRIRWLRWRDDQAVRDFFAKGEGA